MEKVSMFMVHLRAHKAFQDGGIQRAQRGFDPHATRTKTVPSDAFWRPLTLFRMPLTTDFAPFSSEAFPSHGRGPRFDPLCVHHKNPLSYRAFCNLGD